MGDPVEAEILRLECRQVIVEYFLKDSVGVGLLRT
jgi:hypothetical protein